MWFWLAQFLWFLQWPGSARNQGRLDALPGHQRCSSTAPPGAGGLDGGAGLGLSVSGVQTQVQTPGDLAPGAPRWAVTLPGTTRSACCVSGVSHTELGVPQGKVLGDWLLLLYTDALSLRRVAPSRVGGWNSAAVNLGETGCTFPFKTNPEATAPSEGRARCWQHLGLSPAEAPTEAPASLCSVQIRTKFLSPIQMRLALPLLNVLVRKPTS